MYILFNMYIAKKNRIFHATIANASASSCFSCILYVGASLSIPGCLHLVDSIKLIIPVITKALPGYILNSGK